MCIMFCAQFRDEPPSYELRTVGRVVVSTSARAPIGISAAITLVIIVVAMRFIDCWSRVVPIARNRRIRGDDGVCSAVACHSAWHRASSL
jgi:hypothetical protein